MNTTVSFQKLSDVPATLSGLSVKAGDSIIFKENPSPAGKFTVINVIDPLNPKFDGYIDSTALLSYPQQTLIPAFLKFGVYNSGWQTRVMRSKDMVLVSNGAVLSMYKIANDSLVFIRDSVISQGYTIRQMLLFTDTLACVIADYSYSSSGNNPLPWSTFYKYSFIYPVQLASSGFSCFPGYQIPAINDASTSFTLHSSTSTSSAGYFNIHGCHDNNIIMSIRQWKTSFYTVMTNPPNTSQDSSASVAVTDAHGSDQTVIPLGNPDAGWPNASAANTGCSLSPTEYVYSAGPALFVADIRDLPDGYHTAAANNAVYGDSGAGALQNILLDTITKKAYVFYASKLSILSYQRQAVDVANGSNKLTALKGISIIPHTSLSGVTIVLPSNCRSADLFIYGINGRVVDRMRNVSARFVFWRPKTRSTGFYIAVVKSERTRYVSKFMVQ
jgi:hypothetical protein